MKNAIIYEALSFDDVLLLPNYSEVLPQKINTETNLTKNISMMAPILSAAMDTVTESQTAISMARQGGIGFIHRNLTIKQQAQEVDVVKRSESGMITNPVTISPSSTVKDIQKIMKQYKISGLPVIKGDKLVGIVTNRDLRFETNINKKVEEVMTKENLVKVFSGTDFEEAKKLLHKNKIEKLLVVDKEDKLVGLITIKDLKKKEKYPNACKDSKGRLRVGAAIGVSGDVLKRVEALIAVEADVFVIDTSHGHSKNVIEMVKTLKKNFSNIEVVAGNVATEDGAKALIDAGVDAVKIGIGPGSICTTRVVSGIGVPQFTAIQNCVEIARKHKIPIIADGGIKFSGDITKAIGAGANSVMLGSLLAGTKESPGETIFFEGRNYKTYRGMGSIEAMRKGSKDRYYQTENEKDNKLVPEGIVGRVPYRGTIEENLWQLLGGLKAGMGYVGAKNIKELHKKAKFIKISSAGMKESHVHNVIVTKGSPNYRME